MVRQAYPARRLLVVIIGVMMALVFIWLQVVRWQILYAASQPTAPDNDDLPAMGTVVDRRGFLMAMDVPTYTLTVDTNIIRKDEVAEVRAWLLEQGFDPAKVAEVNVGQGTIDFTGVSFEQAQAARDIIAELWDQGRYPWLRVNPTWTRYFPNGPVAAHVLGFRNWSNVALGGVHARYADFLTTGRGLAPEWAEPASPPGGTSPMFPSPHRRDLALTIDVGVQYIAEKELARAVERYEALSGAVIIMDPRDGRIWALASYPTFDPNRFYAYDENAWMNRAVSMIYEPGSVVKAVTFAAAYDAGIITETTKIRDEAMIMYGGRPIRNSQGRGYGDVTPAEILARSLNVATAKVAVELNTHLFYQYLDRFGFGKKTEVDLAGEERGLVRRPGDPLWSLFDLAANSYGQGIGVTPIQLIRAMAVIANGGRLVTPHVLKGYYLEDTYHEVSPPPGPRVIQKKTARVLTKWLAGVVDAITVPDRVDNYRAAGKTGTAQVAVDGGGYSETDVNVTFVGYFPVEDPQVIILVFLERPQKGPWEAAPEQIWAYNTAYPTFVRIADAVAPLLDIQTPARSEESP